MMSDNLSIASSECDSAETSASEDDPQNNQTKKSRHKSSSVHDHFTFDPEDGRYHCKLCRISYPKKKDGSTSSLNKHLKTKHESVLIKKGSKSQMENFLTTGQIKKFEPFTLDGLRSRLCQFIIKTDQPFTIVEDQAFRDLLLYCNSSAKSPCAGTIRTDLSKLFLETQKSITTTLQSTPGKLSFVVDGWTSKNQKPYLGIIAQWVSEDWELCSLALDMKILSGPHTGLNLAASFMESLKEFGISRKIQSIVTDNTGNMNTFISSFEDLSQNEGPCFDAKNYHVRCLAHIVNLCCQACLKSVACSESYSKHGVATPEEDSTSQENEPLGNSKGIIAQLRKGIVKIRSSPQRRESFKRQCDVLSVNALELICDVSTRWNSTLDMISRAIEFRAPFECTLRADKELCKLLLSDEDWQKLSKLKGLLEPFKDVTVFMSAERYATISFCAIVYSTLYKHLELYKTNATKEYPDYLVEAAKTGLEKLDKYYPTSDGNSYVIATILDPRFKLNWYKSAAGFRPEVISAYRKAITIEWTNHYKPAPLEEAQDLTIKKNPSLFAQELAKLSRTETRDELQLYLSEKTATVEAVSGGVFQWWKNHRDDFPNLSKMAMDYLSVPGTGVPVERLFSTGPDLLSVRRLSLSPESIRECLCLKSWLKFENKCNIFPEMMREAISKLLGDDE